MRDKQVLHNSKIAMGFFEGKKDAQILISIKTRALSSGSQSNFLPFSRFDFNSFLLLAAEMAERCALFAIK